MVTQGIANPSNAGSSPVAHSILFYKYCMKEKNLAVLIDCWHTATQFLPFDCDTIIYKNIIDFVDNDPTIHAVCLASYNVVKDEYFSDNHWYNSISQKHFNYKRFLKHNRSIKLKDVERTSKHILKWKSTKKQFVAHFPDQISDKYDKIYLCGKAFELCINRRPLGLFNLHDKQNIYMNEKCVLTKNGKQVNLSNNPNWIKESNGHYKNIGVDTKEFNNWKEQSDWWAGE